MSDNPGVDSFLSPLARQAPPSMSRVDGAVRISFDQGLPDPSLFPVELIRTELDAVLSEDGAAALTYYGASGTSEMRFGHRGLRSTLAERISTRDGRQVGADGVLLANGSSDGLSLIARALLGPGDGAIVESATYRHASNYMSATGATVRPTSMDEFGLTIDGLERTVAGLAADGIRPKVLYTIPTFHSPTGSVLPTGRRLALIELARALGIMVVEDNCYYEFAYDEPAPPTLLSLDDSGLVVQSDSFSKCLTPGLRLGWVAADPAVIAALAAVRQDFAVSQLLARVVERILIGERLDPHLDLLRASYRDKRDLTASLLESTCHRWVTFETPAGGFYFWLRVGSGLDTSEVVRRLGERGVAVRSGEWFTLDGAGRSFLRLSPIQLSEPEIREGIAALAEVLDEVAAESKR